MENTTDLFGIPVPSTDRLFLTFVVIHILISLVCVISGLVAMFAKKGGTNHSYSGKIYYWAMLFAFITVVILSIMRWPHNIHLLCIGIFAITCTYFGYRLTKKKRRHWTRPHTVFMSSSYIFLLTGFYVDNGKNLPFWKLFPQWFFWIFPAMIGVPIIMRVLRKHPLNQR
jgi:xanthine/uracil permease